MGATKLVVVLLLLLNVVCTNAQAKPKKGLSEKELDDLIRSMDREEFEEIRNKKSVHARNTKQKFNPNNFDPKNFDASKLLAQSKSGKPLMVICTLKNASTKNHAEELVVAWNHALKQAMIKAQSFVLSEEKVLLNLDDGGDVFKAQEFLFKQPEVDFIEYDSQKYYGPMQTKPRDEI